MSVTIKSLEHVLIVRKSKSVITQVRLAIGPGHRAIHSVNCVLNNWEPDTINVT